MEWEKNIMNMIGRTFPFFCYMNVLTKFFLLVKMQNKNVKLLQLAFWNTTHTPKMAGRHNNGGFTRPILPHFFGEKKIYVFNIMF